MLDPILKGMIPGVIDSSLEMFVPPNYFTLPMYHLFFDAQRNAYKDDEIKVGRGGWRGGRARGRGEERRGEGGASFFLRPSIPFYPLYVERIFLMKPSRAYIFRRIFSTRSEYVQTNLFIYIPSPLLHTLYETPHPHPTPGRPRAVYIFPRGIAQGPGGVAERSGAAAGGRAQGAAAKGAFDGRFEISTRELGRRERRWIERMYRWFLLRSPSSSVS